MESVELATILLTDLVGSTRVANLVGPVRADELREEHFELLRGAIASSGGHEVKNTGDGLMVAFPSASAAVRCAVAMQQLFERRYRGAEEALHVRIGLGAGESTVKDGDYFGMPSIEASRLCAQAGSDGILISGLAKALAGRCEGIEFESAGELELKGFPDPVEAFSVSWAPLSDEARELGDLGRWPLPAVLRAVPALTYVGRVSERAALEEALVGARGGTRRAVLLSGEPGIGKTRLASFAAHRAHAEGFAVSWGACSEELAVPYEPWIAVCSQLVQHAPRELLERHVAGHGGEVGRLARSLRERVPDLPEPQSSDPETERYLLFSAVVGLLEEVARMVPSCVVLDDMHWADAQSVGLLKHLVRTVEEGTLQVITTYRDTDVGKDHPLTSALADLRAVQGVERISLRGLEPEDVAQIMSDVAGCELEADAVALAAEIARETDGNPFFVGEILRGLSDSGALAVSQESGRLSVGAGSAIALPESVREVIERRVERLGSEAIEVLTQAAVIGRVFDVELLAASSDLGEGPLLDHLESAVAASLLSESDERVGEFRFAHALINQTLYEGLGATRRARMHHRVAKALEELHTQHQDERLAELALHWRLAAVSSESVRAADYALRAGRQALEGLAPAAAAALFADAVEMLGDADSAERCTALIGLGEAQLQSGEAAHRETLLEASRIAVALADGELAARAALANSRAGTGSYSFGVVDQERVEAIRGALELDEPPNASRRARLLALEAQELSWDPDFAHRRSLTEHAIELARESGDQAVLADVLVGSFLGAWSAETLDRRTALAEEHAELAAELRDPAMEMLTQLMRTEVCAEHGQLAQAESALSRWGAVAAELGHPAHRWFAAYQTAGFELLRGRLDSGERLAERALEIGQEAGQPDAPMVYGGQLSFLRVLQGRSQEILGMLEEGVRAFPGIVVWRGALAVALCAADRDDEARVIVAQAAADRFEHLGPSSDLLSALSLFSDAAVFTRHAAAAEALYERIAPFSDQVVWMTSQGYGHARLWLGLLAGCMGEHEQAEEHLAFAREFHVANDMPVWSARGHLGRAEALAGAGDAAAAREPAERAAALARENGYVHFEKRAAALLAGRPASEL